MKYLYKYPQAEFPYGQLVEENRRRGKNQPEFELLDTGVFDDNRYFDVFVEYAKADTEDILIKITVANRGPEAANLRLLPTVWFRNTWSWGGRDRRPELHQARPAPNPVIELNHDQPGKRWLHCEGSPELLFTENETNARAAVRSREPHALREGRHQRLRRARHQRMRSIRSTPAQRPRLTTSSRLARARRQSSGCGLPTPISKATNAFADFDKTFALRQREADEFYAHGHSPGPFGGRAERHASGLCRHVVVQAVLSLRRQRLAGRRSRQSSPAAGAQARAAITSGPTCTTRTLSPCPTSGNIRGMRPGTWRFTAFRWRWWIPTSPKSSSSLMLREWYMHPNGQIPAYEWAFGDVNPPVHAWAAWRVYKIDKKRKGKGDRAFLQRVFHKLMLNFTWWVNRKDADGMNIFQGGFLGLDNIGVFDRSAPLPTGGYIEQSDGTSWMAMYTLNLLAIALELATGRSVLRRCGQQVLGALHLHRPRHEPSRRRQHGTVERGRRLLLRRAEAARRQRSSR